jgi:ubiquitin C-terminal hydrolase
MQPRNNYVGIRNLGSICYMNSILQQFFMIKQFYNMVMGLQSATEVVEIKEVRLVDDFLAQLQEMYIHLACSQKQYYDPTKFCLSVKDAQNNPINVNVQ